MLTAAPHWTTETWSPRWSCSWCSRCPGPGSWSSSETPSISGSRRTERCRRTGGRRWGRWPASRSGTVCTRMDPETMSSSCHQAGSLSVPCSPPNLLFCQDWRLEHFSSSWLHYCQLHCSILSCNLFPPHRQQPIKQNIIIWPTN